MAQSQDTNNTLTKIELASFSNKDAYEMGSAIIKLAESKNQKIAIEVARLNHSVFLYFAEGLPADKHDWLRRKANVAKRFEESSLAVKNDLARGGMTLEQTFGLDSKDYIDRGGAIPIFVKGAGMVATITVSGLKDVEDHGIIVEALKGTYIK